MEIPSLESSHKQFLAEIPNLSQPSPIGAANASHVNNEGNPPDCIAACTGCPACQLSLCGGIEQQFVQVGSLARMLPSSIQRIPERHTIFHHKEWSEFVPFICSGWAATSVGLADGRRQTLSFLLPGDTLSMACLFEPMSGRTVEAITDVEYRKFKRSELKAILFRHPHLMDKVSKIWSDERNQFDQMALDLGRRTADERVARLVVNLVDRLAKRGMRNGDTIEFPLRQRHIADATGLTPVHVNKVLCKFQRAGLFDISDRRLTIFDEAELCRAAEWH
jgi:CRP/FNR family transcriptional regulator, anaerobic regulatory protein